jgi:hypothetical protein
MNRVDRFLIYKWVPTYLKHFSKSIELNNIPMWVEVAINEIKNKRLELMNHANL